MDHLNVIEALNKRAKNDPENYSEIMDLIHMIETNDIDIFKETDKLRILENVMKDMTD